MRWWCSVGLLACWAYVAAQLPLLLHVRCQCSLASVSAIYDRDCIISAMQLATIDLKVCPHCEQCNRRGHSRTSFPHTTIIVLGGGTYLYSTYPLTWPPPSTTSHGPGGTMCRYLLLLLLLCLAILLARPSTAIDWSLVDVHRNRISRRRQSWGWTRRELRLTCSDRLVTTYKSTTDCICHCYRSSGRDEMGQEDRTGQQRR